MYLDIKLFGSIPFGIHWAVLACSCFWLVAKSYALFEKLSAIIQKNFFWSVFPIQYSVRFTVHQSESATHIHISPFFWISFPFRPSENDGTGNSAIIFYLLFFIFNFMFNLLCYLTTGLWSYVHSLSSLFSRLVNIQTYWSFCHLQYIVNPCSFLIIYFLVLPIGLDF